MITLFLNASFADTFVDTYSSASANRTEVLLVQIGFFNIYNLAPRWQAQLLRSIVFEDYH